VATLRIIGGPDPVSRHRVGTARVLALALLLLVVLASTAGITGSAVFTSTSTLKQAITVAVPLSLIAVLMSSRPLLLLTYAAIVLIPLDLVVTVGGIGVSPLDLILGLCWPFVYLKSGHSPNIKMSRVGWASIAAAVAAAVPLINASSPAEFLHLFLSAAAVAYLVSSHARDATSRFLLVQALVVSAALQAALALYEVATGRLLDLYSTTGGSSPDSTYFFNFDTTFRPAGTLPDPIALGNLLSIGLVLAVALALCNTSTSQKLLAAACGGIIALGLLFSLSRTSWVGAVLGIACILLLSPRRLAVRAVLGILVGSALVVGVAFAADGKALTDRYNSISNPTSSSNSTAAGDKTRLQIWHAALQVAEEHPLDGVGFGHIRDALYGRVQGAGPGTHAHSVYLNVLAEGGAVGAGGLLVLLMACVLDASRRVRRRELFGAGLTGALVCTLVGWTTDYTVRNVSIAAFVAAVIGLLAYPRDLRNGRSVGAQQSATRAI
jgi:O-antigen ligase